LSYVTEIKVLAAAGKTRSEIAAALGISYVYACVLAKANNIPVARSYAGCIVGAEHAQRAEKMSAMFRQGLTMEVIGSHFELTRERVRQILKKAGLVGCDGGQRVTAVARKQRRSTVLDSRSLIRHGLPHAEVRRLSAIGALRAYRQQRTNAKNRGVAFKLNLAQWWAVWQASGKWELRGRGIGHYCMSRIKDSGGYEVGNVHVQEAVENSREAVRVWRGEPGKVFRGVYHLYPGTRKPFIAKVGKKYIGSFSTPEEAHNARVAFARANGIAFDKTGRLSMRAA
jgi:hypothetical protein